MHALIIVIVVILVIGAGFGAIASVRWHRSRSTTGHLNNSRAKALLDIARRKLAAHPNDPGALADLAKALYETGSYDESAQYYEKLFAIIQDASSSLTMDSYDAYITYGFCSMQRKRYDDAFRAFSTALSMGREGTPDHKNLIMGLGECEYYRKNYDKALYFLQPLLVAYPNMFMAKKYLGMSYYRLRKYKEAIALLSQVSPQSENDKDITFMLGSASGEIGLHERALEYFNLLLADPAYGSTACLHAGSINMNLARYDAAIENFRLGLKHENLRMEVSLELKRRLAGCLIKKGNNNAALTLLREIRTINPGYKNVSTEIQKYEELVANKNYNLYLNASTGEFIDLCRRCLSSFFPQAKIKVISASEIRSECIDIQAEVKGDRWSDMILFRYYRGDKLEIDERRLQDLYNRAKEKRMERAFCISAGPISPSAVNYADGRSIDLVDKQRLIKALASA